MSKPFLCRCGRAIDVSSIPTGSRFRCPHCEHETALDASDPGLLSNFQELDGVYSLLLRRRVPDESDLVAAQPVHPRMPSPVARALDADGSRDNADSLGVRRRSARPGQGARPSPDPDREVPALGTSVSGTSVSGSSVSGSSVSGTSVSDTSTAPPPGRAEITPPPLGAGDRLGPFRIEGILGQGGMGTVYRAFDTSLQRPVALKVLADVHARNEELVDRFRREARAAGALTHPNITLIYSIGEERGYHYFAMELVEGKTLGEVLRERGRLSEEDAIDYLVQVARGLRAAKSKRIIHRDIKPSNLILSEDGLIKITDFGLAKVVTSPVDLTATGVIIGTPLYISPEQGQGEPLDHRSDIYSLGCSFYHLLAGSPPFEGESAMKIIVQHITDEVTPLRQRCSSVSPRLAEVIHRMVEKNPLDRFQDYERLIEAIAALSTGGAGQGSSTRLERGPGRIVLVSERPQEVAPSSSMGLKQLSVADVNLELGRHEKALGLYLKVLEENPELELELGFRILKIHQQRQDDEAAREWTLRLLAASPDPQERFYCRWKLISEALTACHESSAVLARTMREALDDGIPEDIQESRFQQRIAELEALENKLSRDQSVSILLIRRSGDLQIELE